MKYGAYLIDLRAVGFGFALLFRLVLVLLLLLVFVERLAGFGLPDGFGECL
jgi:hypothetical protein